VIDDSGHILTNNHVISAAAGGGTITVVFSDGRTDSAKLIGRDPQTDVAVLQVAHPSGLSPITFGSSENLQVGQPVVALGAPLGLSSTVTSGIVSALDRSVDVPSDDGTTAILVAAIQTDAAINPGNSGGALVNCSGQLVGVPSAGATVPTEGGGASAGNIGIGFAIPSDFAKSIASELIAKGTVSHGFLGVSVMTVGGGSQQGSAPPGLYVTSVTPAGPAAQAGLQAGDIITEIEGSPAASAEQLLTLTLTHRAGEIVSLTYQRQGTPHQAQVTLGSR
jgi:putative serine protease PepD